MDSQIAKSPILFHRFPVNLHNLQMLFGPLYFATFSKDQDDTGKHRDTWDTLAQVQVGI